MTARTVHGRNALGPGGLVVVIEHGRISALSPTADAGDGAPWIGPGLIDLQVNGHLDGDANAAAPDPAHITAMAGSLAAHGVTRFLPTVITAAPDEMLARIRAIHDAVRSSPETSRAVAGIHVEGPALSEQDGPRGVHPLAHIRPPAIAELQTWLDAAPGLVRIVTLSPHHPGAVDATRFLVAHGVRVSIGHTHASDAEIAAVVDAGATLSTHLGNGAHALLPRHPNYLWTQLAERRLAAGVIADGHHLPDATLATMLAAKRDHGIFLVSDAVATPAALRDGGESTVGGGVHLADDGALRHVSSGFLAGSVQTLDVGVATVARLTGSLAGALRLATSAPASVLDDAPHWTTGARADVLLFDWAPGDRAIIPREVLVAGETAHETTDARTAAGGPR
ncbi:N-acetylglucosamine-6-phosphate deacetylase [Microbacterium sp. SSW1-49]|uniref:N-acetylglucosamine-6-phosphate deacetylase n=1 Tax=Microbacterium croceum TaxID=2851645 RepID=A0ABT0FB01_9MICO|nr:N-acetylglucosamine-6-phosphate deacetylase [Microbacterium croceum]MCK2035245.1 N-acetylglucosamine-6-phosphate deacetylase [Microbacterium croceum]